MPPQPEPLADDRLCVLVMGPSGVGKSTFAQALAVALDAAFIEGDDHHPAANREAMQAGRPLTDEMRGPWLLALSSAVRQSLTMGPTVFACSALKRRYRDTLRDQIGPLRIVGLTAPPGLIRQRMTQRQHFMPAALLDSQINTLEAPTPDEQAILVDMSCDLTQALRDVVTQLAR